jgi:hypothetical protein
MEVAMFAHRVLLAVGAATLLLASTAQAQPARLRGKIVFSSEPVKDHAPRALGKQFARAKPVVDLKRNKNKEWEVYIIAFLNRKPVPGPLTIWMYEKGDKAAMRANEPISAKSVDRKGLGKTFVHNLLIDPDLGFNKNHSYVVWVGQILGRKNKVYARGTVNLKP